MSSGPVSCSTSAPSHAASNPLSSDNEEEWLAHFRAELQRNQESRLAELLQQAEAEFQRASGLLAARHAHVDAPDSLSDDAFNAAKAKLLRTLDTQKRRIRRILEEEEEELIEHERGIRNHSLDGKVEGAEAQIREQEELFRMYQAQVQYSESANVNKTEKSPLPSVPSRRTTRDPPPRPISSQRSNASTLPSEDRIRNWHDIMHAARRNTESRDTLSPNRYQDRQQSSLLTRMPESLPQNTASVMQHSRNQNQSRSSSRNPHRIWLPSALTGEVHRPSTGMLQKQPQIIPEPTPVLNTTTLVSARGTSDSPHSLVPKQDSYLHWPSPSIPTHPSPFVNDLRPPSPRSLPGSMAMPGGNLSRYQSKVLEPVAHAQTAQDTRSNKFLPHTREKSYAMEDSFDFEPSSASPGAGSFNERVRSSPTTSALSDRMAKERDRDKDRKQKEREEALRRQEEEERTAEQRRKEDELRTQEDELKRQEWALHQREEALARRQKEEELRAKEEALERHRREQQREEELARREEEDERRRNEERAKKDREGALRRQREEEDRKRVEGHVLKKLEKEREREQEEREARERQAREREEREGEKREKEALRERERRMQRDWEDERTKREEYEQREKDTERRRREDEEGRRTAEELKQQEELARFYEQRKLQEDARRRDPRGTASSSSFSHSIPNPSASFSSASGSLPSGRAASSASSTHPDWSGIRRLPLSSASSAALKLSRASTASPAISAWLPSTRPTFASASSSSSNLTEPGESHKATAGSWKTPGSAGIGADPSPTSGGGSGSYMNSSPLSEVEWRRLQEENARKQQEQFWRDCLQAEQEREAQAAAATTASAGGHEQLLRVWAAYESAWASLKDRPVLFFRSIPWPILRQPSDAEDLTADAIGAFVLSPAHSSDKSTPDRLKEQLLRWDPDCFESKWLLKVNMEEKELVRRSVEQVVCGLNKLQDPIEVLKRLLLKLKDLDLTDKLHGEPTWKAGGGYADVLLGQLTNGKPVAIKRLRTHLLQTDPVKLTKTVSRELRVWSKAPQKNILPLKGYLLEIIDGLPYPIPSFVTDWMEAGSLTQYLHSGREVRSLFLIEGIANGLDHLHNSKIIHGDLKSQNVLISMDGEPLLTDFGLSHLITSTSTCETATDAIKGSSRWQSPELINPKDDVSYSEVIHTEKSDIWAFGMTGLEVLTKKLPYASLRTDGQIFLAIHQGRLPTEPTDLQGRKDVEKNLWKLCTGCWVKDPLERPSAAQLLQALEQLRNSST